MMWTVVTGAQEPELGFETLSAVAVHLLAARAARDADLDLALTLATVTRDAYPSGRYQAEAPAIAVRLQDGAHDGRGRLLGYVIGPPDAEPQRLRERIMVSLLNEVSRSRDGVSICLPRPVAA